MYHRIAIIGKSGSGKTILATKLAERLKLAHVELDALLWEPDWKIAPDDVLRERADAALVVDGRWVVDGNYSRLRDITWARGEVLVWLDYDLGVTMWRLVWRTLGRIVWQTELWNGNRERIGNHFTLDTEENMFLNNIINHNAQRARFAAAIEQPEYSHLTVLRFRNPSDTESWLAGLPESPDTTTGTHEEQNTSHG